MATSPLSIYNFPELKLLPLVRRRRQMVVVVAVVVMLAGLGATATIGRERIIVPTIGGRPVVGMAIWGVVILELGTGGVTIVASGIVPAVASPAILFVMGEAFVLWTGPEHCITTRAPSVAVAALRRFVRVIVVSTVVGMRILGAKSCFSDLSDFGALIF